MFRDVVGDHLLTRYEDSPRVTLYTKEDSPVGELTFVSSPIAPDGTLLKTQLVFTHLIEFRFTEFDLGLVRSNITDAAFRLIELIDSDILAIYAESNVLGKVALPVLAMDDLHHYRISFDDHGTYDIISVGLELSTTRVSSKMA